MRIRHSLLRASLFVLASLSVPAMAQPAPTGAVSAVTAPDSAAAMKAELQAAASAMAESRDLLARNQADAALVAEQDAVQHLLAAKALLKTQA